ncbi:GntR family transcriptional regulator [Streptomyces sp. NPDC101062]|uniref:GntR family transcriptional regulator n=1 Tax=unclassified Streptomyces TaxID=2593676 RepID=UPI00380C9A32
MSPGGPADPSENDPPGPATVEEIVEVIRGRIAEGVYPCGSTLRRTSFQEEFNAPAWVIDRVMGRLAEQGLVNTRIGSGTRVADPKAQPPRCPGQPVIHCVTHTVALRIVAGVYPTGAPLPRVALLSEEFDVSQDTVRVCLLPLKSFGVLKTRGNKILVTEVKIPDFLAEPCQEPLDLNAEFKRLYLEEGIVLKEIAARKGYSYGFVRDRLVDLGVPLRQGRSVASGSPPDERDILRLVAEGHTDRAIEGELRISAGTVRRHLDRFTKRHNLRNRTHAVAYAVREKLI